jgi:NADPH:quinone reductase-like Zn-dependent oxidoreductase
MTTPAPRTMQAWLTTGAGIDELVPHEVVVPSLGPNDVLIEVRALSLNYRDLLVIEGVDGWKPPRAVVPISDALGVVVQTGAASRRFAIGDRVLPTYLPKWRTGPLTDDVYVSPVGGPQNRGFLSQFAAVDEQELVAAPQSIDDLRAATLPIAGVTAWHSLQRTAVHRDDSVLVHGTGGAALYATQLAHALGANVIVTSSSDDKLRRVRDLGVDASVNYRTEDVAEAVREITQGRGVDIVVETVGGDNLNVSLDACSLGARSRSSG